MTKHYHVTPEQTLELANEVEAAGFDITVYQDGGVEGHTVDAFQALNNAALDEVLGEPILFASPQYEELLEHHNGHTLCSGKKSELHTLALYAPRRKK